MISQNEIEAQPFSIMDSYQRRLSKLKVTQNFPIHGFAIQSLPFEKPSHKGSAPTLPNLTLRGTILFLEVKGKMHLIHYPERLLIDDELSLNESGEDSVKVGIPKLSKSAEKFGRKSVLPRKSSSRAYESGTLILATRQEALQCFARGTADHL